MNDPNETADRAVAGASTRMGLVLLAASVLPIMAIVSLIPILPMLQREFADTGGADYLVPVALTVPALCVAMFSPIAGWLSDRLGRKRLLVVSLGLYAICGILPWFLEDLASIIASRMALGVMEASIMTVSTALIGDYFEGEEREKWIALQVAVGGVAATFLIASGGILGDAVGSRGPFLLYLLAIPVAALAAVILIEPAHVSRPMQTGITPFPYRAILPLLLITVGVGIVFYTVNVKLGPILELAGDISSSAIGLVGALCNVAMGAGTFVFHALKRHTGPGLLVLGLALASTGYTGMGLSANLPSIVSFSLLACFGAGILLPNMLSWTMAATPPDMRGRGTGLWTGAFFLAQFFAPLVATVVANAASGLGAALVIYGIAIAGGAIAAAIALHKAGPTA